MKTSELEKLAAAVPSMMDRLGLARFQDGYGDGYEADTAWGCRVVVRLIAWKSPWLACRFEDVGERPRPFAHIPGANPFTGKLNCHPGVVGRTTADDLLYLFEFHITNNIRPLPQPDRSKRA